MAEWPKLLAHGALRLLSPKETRVIRQTKPDRVVGSRYVNTLEPDAEAEDGMKVKSRFCLLGHQHPDVPEIVRKVRPRFFRLSRASAGPSRSAMSKQPS